LTNINLKHDSGKQIFWLKHSLASLTNDQLLFFVFLEIGKCPEASLIFKWTMCRVWLLLSFPNPLSVTPIEGFRQNLPHCYVGNRCFSRWRQQEIGKMGRAIQRFTILSRLLLQRVGTLCFISPFLLDSYSLTNCLNHIFMDWMSK